MTTTPDSSEGTIGSENRDNMMNTLSTDKLDITTSLEGLQSKEQRLVLDVVAQLRKCGLESILSLPQLVVCGDQSAGKSSVLEALTEIPFPRNDNLCTRFATEIILRRAAVDSLTIKVIPDPMRPIAEQASIKSFKESITSFDDLPDVMDKATAIMGIDSDRSSSKGSAFARDVLSIEIEGPSRPQLTLVDLPGLVQTKTKGVSDADIKLVHEITDHYISQPRTICLAVISATNDYANQSISAKVRGVDSDGERTLGIITKPDRLVPGSGMEKDFIGLARNEDIFFKLGWHVLKNRTFEEGDSSFEERNASEASYFRTSAFSVLPGDSVGIDSLRERLSRLLFNHIKQELPRLREDLETALADSKKQLTLMGQRRATPKECRDYLTFLSLGYYEVCKAAVAGHYEGESFSHNIDQSFDPDSPNSMRRLRAVVQQLNANFSKTMRASGHKYHIDRSSSVVTAFECSLPEIKCRGMPTQMSSCQAIEWARQALMRTRGKELSGNFNPLVVGELFWEQASNWRSFALKHAEKVASVCSQFLETLLREKCPKDVQSRLWSSHIQDALKKREEAAVRELDLIIEDLDSYPINYNHYYTDTIRKQQLERSRNGLETSIENATTHTKLDGCHSHHTSASIDVDLVLQKFAHLNNADMEIISCEEALNCVLAIYKVQQKTFIANITTQVVERHIVRGLEKILSPLVINGFSDTETQAVASEPSTSRRQRTFLEDRVKKLEDGYGIIRGVMGSM